MAEPKGLNYKGTVNGDIKTPMTSENVDNQGDGKVHSYKNITKVAESGGGNGGAEIKGPGANANWSAGIKIKGSNCGKY